MGADWATAHVKSLLPALTNKLTEHSICDVMVVDVKFSSKTQHLFGRNVVCSFDAIEKHYASEILHCCATKLIFLKVKQNLLLSVTCYTWLKPCTAAEFECLKYILRALA